MALFVSAFLLSFLWLPASSAIADAESDSSRGPVARIGGPAQMPGEVLVKFKKPVPLANKRLTHVREDVDVIAEIHEIGIDRVRARRGESMETLLQRYRQNPDVEYAEPNIIYQARIIPNDPLFSSLWGLHNIGQAGGTVDADIDAPEAWDSQVGSPSVVVADIDSGMDLTHPDLAANLWVNPGEIIGNGIDDDGNGYIDDYRGWDFVNNDSNPSDDGGHGSHTAGIIAAVGNNGVGVTGVAWQARVMPLKFLDAGGNGLTSDAVDAILYAANMGVRIINASWGCNGVGCYSQALEDAIAYANSAGVLVVVAAGNNGTNNDVTPDYPCVSTQPNVICVSATTRNDQLASFSNYGSSTVDLGAPGSAILSTVPTGSCGLCDPSRYLSVNGTSSAAPHVSGAAALILSQFPSYTLTQVRDAILSTVDPIPALTGRTTTGGRLNVQRALLSNFTVTAAPVSQAVTAGGSTTYAVTVTSQGAFSGSVALTLGAMDANLAGSFIPTTVTVPASGTATSTLTISAQPSIAIGSYPVVIRGTAAGEVHTTTVTVVISPPDLVMSAVTPLSTAVPQGGPLSVSNTVQNQGGSNAGTFTIALHLSVDALYGGTDDIALSPLRSISSLVAASSNSATTLVTVSYTTPAGTYYVCGMADSGGVISEANAEGNNTLCSTSPIDVTASPATGAKLLNISTRGAVVSAAGGSLNGGFIIGAANGGTKQVLIRARGPSMGGAPFNVPGTLTNPTMRLVSAGTTIAQNDNWQITDPLCLSPATTCGNAAQITATGRDPCVPNPGQTTPPPGCANEAALLVTLPPGPYSVVVSGVSGTTGIALVEAFEADTGSQLKLVNISTRGTVVTAPAGLLNGGFIIGPSGTGSKQVLIRARGPSMSGAPFNVPGTLVNPTMRLVSAGTTIAQNDNWQTTDLLCGSPAASCGNSAQISATGKDPCMPNPGQTAQPPNCGNEAALLVTLPPGPYSVVVSGVGGTTGIALVEVFDVP
ncbi:MAG: S8 family serine peptidase [Nitrospirota bacterium]